MNDFRDTMEKTIKEIMRERLLLIQEETHFNNQKMANALIMDPRSFFDLRSGENECGLTTSMMIIIYTSDRNALLNEMDIRLRNCMDKSEEKETLPI